MTEEERKQKMREYHREWRRNNKEKVRQSLERQKLKPGYNEKRAQLQRNWHKNNPDKSKEMNKKYYEEKKTKSRFLSIKRLQGARDRAGQMGLEFNLDLSDMEYGETCPVLGIPLDKSLGHNNRPEVDRIDNSIGYTKDNVCIISSKANRIKSDATIEELEAILAYMKAHRDR